MNVHAHDPAWLSSSRSRAQSAWAHRCPSTRAWHTVPHVPMAAVLRRRRDSLRRDSSVYTACYCEENVYNLLRLSAPLAPRSFAVFISNAARACAVHGQLASAGPSLPVVWDYHVVLVVFQEDAASGGWVVYDLDSRLSFPCPLASYLASAFPSQAELHQVSRAAFRLIPTADYLAWFSSDRRHMRQPGGGGGWASPPPAYPPICGLSARGAGLLHSLEWLWSVEEGCAREGGAPAPAVMRAGSVHGSVDSLVGAITGEGVGRRGGGGGGGGERS